VTKRLKAVAGQQYLLLQHSLSAVTWVNMQWNLSHGHTEEVLNNL